MLSFSRSSLLLLGACFQFVECEADKDQLMIFYLPHSDINPAYFTFGLVRGISLGSRSETFRCDHMMWNGALIEQRTDKDGIPWGYIEEKVPYLCIKFTQNTFRLLLLARKRPGLNLTWAWIKNIVDKGGEKKSVTNLSKLHCIFYHQGVEKMIESWLLCVFKWAEKP